MAHSQFLLQWIKSTKKLVETICRGEFLAKNEEEAEEYFEWLAEHTPDWAENRDSIRSLLQAKSLNQLRS